MGKLAFGNDENLKCIQDIELKGAKGEALCIGYKTSVRLIGAPVWITDDGYVLKVRDASDGYYPMPIGEELRTMQAEGLIPDPLPPYSLGVGEIFIGTITWWLLGIFAVFMGFGHWRGRHRRAFLAADEAPSTAAPTLTTDEDRWLRNEILDQVPAGDDLQHQACCYTSDPSESGIGAAAKRKVRYVGLTRDHLVIIESRLGALKPLRENNGVSVIPRAEIAEVHFNEDVLVVELADESSIELWPDPKQKYFSNQWRFTRDVPRLLNLHAAA